MEKKLFLSGLISCFIMFSLVGYGLGRTKAHNTSNSTVEQVHIVSAFRELQTVWGECQLECTGRWQDGTYSVLEKQEFLESLAEELGITDGYLLKVSSTERKERTDLYKNGKYAYTMLSIVTDKEREINYVLIKIDFTELTDSAIYYKKRLKELLKENRISGNITLGMSGSYEGELTREQKDQLTGYFFEKMEGNTVENGNLDELYTVYGYTREIEEYLVINGNKTNINVAISYDETKDETNIYVATPVINKSY